MFTATDVPLGMFVGFLAGASVPAIFGYMRAQAILRAWELDVASLKAAHAEHARTLQQRVADAQHAAAQWRAACVDAQHALVELQRRYAPPEPITGEVEQPPSVLDADATAYERMREREAGV